MIQRYSNNEPLRKGDIFTSVTWRNTRTWKIIELSAEKIGYRTETGANYWDETYYLPTTYNTSAWILIRRGNKSKTGFGKFIAKIEDTTHELS